MPSKYPKVMSGARAKVGFADPNTGETIVVGIYTNISYNVVYDTQAAFILGRYSAAELDYTSVEPVQITASGWRVVGAGRHRMGRLPRVQDLLLHQYLEMHVVDRQAEHPDSESPFNSDPRIAKIKQVRPTAGAENFASRALSEVTMTYMGLIVDDEENVNAEPEGANGGATNLP